MCLVHNALTLSQGVSNESHNYGLSEAGSEVVSGG